MKRSSTRRVSQTPSVGARASTAAATKHSMRRMSHW